MAESDKKFSISWKHTTGYDSPLFNLSADSVGELQNNLAQFFSSGLHDQLLDAIIESQRRYKAKRGDAPAAQPPALAASQTQQQGNWHQQEPPAEDPWASAPPPPQDPWANQATGGGYQQPPAQQQGRGAPNGAPICRCGQVTEFKKSQNGEHSFWRCPSWRWNQGNPTPDHDSIKIN